MPSPTPSRPQDPRSTRRDSFYGRRKTKALRPGQAARLDTLLPKLLLPEAIPADLTSLFPRPVSAVRLEIGFGGGEHLAHEAGANPNLGFIGVEPFVNGMAKMLGLAERSGLANIRLHGEDAGPLLDRLPASSLVRVDLLYPDPWPKKKHWKRRFVGPRNLARLARVIAPDGEFRFASDIPSYVAWTLRHVHASGAFEWTARVAGDWREPWEGWPGTRYEAKAMREGRRPVYLIFRRR